MTRLPLGRDTGYPRQYAPEALCAVPRSETRQRLKMGAELPFRGVDVWNAWELSWLDDGGKPVAFTGTFTVDARSPNIIESKSLKLYLNSLAMTRYGAAEDAAATIERDLSATAGARVGVELLPAQEWPMQTIAELPGDCIDEETPGAVPATVDAGVLRTSGGVCEEALHSHLLRSLCPVTGQPDTGSILVRYRGPRIDRAALLAYLVAYREQQDFHETCVERIFLDLRERCKTNALTVAARYNRRGGLDINPFRSDFEETAGNPRLWRQ